MGFECCYNDSVIEKVKLEALQFDPPKEYQFNFKVEDSLIDPYKIFIALQILDVLTTHEGMKYSCVKEINPLLPERPSLGRIIGHKTALLWWTPYFVSSATLTREEKDWVWKPGNYLMAAESAKRADPELGRQRLGPKPAGIGVATDQTMDVASQRRCSNQMLIHRPITWANSTCVLLNTESISSEVIG